MIKDPLITKRKELTKRGCETYITYTKTTYALQTYTSDLFFKIKISSEKKDLKKDLSTICAISDLNFSSTK